MLGLTAGILNGFFGAGGGLITVPLLRRTGLEAKKCHATSIAVILSLCVLSGLAYFKAGNLDLLSAVSYLPGGMAGAVLGAVLLKKIDNSILRRIFGLVLVFSAVRIFLP
ncbi:MAG: sulfite exporter TauE/SafE family protein [Oscillospiraceae bacterium]|nr:sulfite exporter TauE/SafE family protein [Oscillospiraceae bacterium]